VHVYADLCVGDVSTSNRIVYILAAVNDVSTIYPYQCDANGNCGGDDRAAYELFKLTKNVSTNATTCTALYTYHQYGDNSPDRLAIAYTSTASAKKIFYGGLTLNGLDVTSATTAFSPSRIHDDQHDLIVIPSVTKVISASDGGISEVNYTTSTTFNRLNQGLHISQIHGFSGSATEPNFFVTGEQDTKGFVTTYNNTTQTTTTTNIFGTEPSGGLVDKFNTNRIFANQYSYNSSYYISNDHGGTFPEGGDATHTISRNYWAISNQATFEASTALEGEPNNYGTHTFYQDPVRPDKIYSATCNLNQYDPLHKVFACKMRPGVVFATGTDPKRCCSFFSQILSMAMSSQDKNGFYFTTMKHSLGGPAGPTASQVIKFIGPDIDNSWMSHNEDQTNWQVITPDLKAAPFNYTTLTDADIYGIDYTSCAISHMDKEKLWVGVSYIPALSAILPVPPVVKVLFYNHGVWSNYSEGLSADDHVTWIVSERGSNDGLYLSTLRGVYYRNSNAGINSWIPYSTNLPKIRSEQMEINYTDNTVRAGTYGQGIWRSPLSCPGITTDITKVSITTPFEFTETKAGIFSTAVIPSGNTVYYRAGNQVTLTNGFVAAQGSFFDAFIHACDVGGSSFFRTAEDDEALEEVKKKAQEMKDDFSIYPNPNNGSFTLTFPSMSEEEMEHGEEAENDVSIFDVMGKVILEKKQTTAKVLTIDLSTYPKGIYMVRVVDEDGNSKVKKVIIQ
jgi:predicted secreted protein